MLIAVLYFKFKYYFVIKSVIPVIVDKCMDLHIYGFVLF